MTVRGQVIRAELVSTGAGVKGRVLRAELFSQAASENVRGRVVRAELFSQDVASVMRARVLRAELFSTQSNATAVSPSGPVPSHSVVTLAAAYNGPDPTPNYVWQQASGPTVTLAPNNALATCVVTIPALWAPATVVIQCQVLEATGSTPWATCTLSVARHEVWQIGDTAVASTFSVPPLNTSNIVARLKADSISGSDLDPVTSWAETSGAGLPAAAQSTTANQPKLRVNAINGHKSVEFDGSNDFLSLTGAWLALAQNASNLIVFIAYKLPATTVTTGPRTLLSLSSGTSTAANRMTVQTHNASLFPIDGGRQLDANSLISVAGSSQLATGKLGILTGSFQWANSDLFLYDDGNLIASTLSFQAAGATSNTASLAAAIGANAVGGAEYFTGQIAEIIIVNAPDTPALRANVHTYLYSTYGGTNVPSDYTGTWKSGAGMPSVAGVSHIANGDFNVWRGNSGPPPIATTWQDATYAAPSAGLTYLDVGGTYETWAGDMDVTCGGLWSTANGGDATAGNNTWAAAASGSYDAKWTTMLNNIKTHWTRIPRGTLYLRPFHEMNATWYDWQVRSTEVTAFIAAWQRFRGLQQSIFPAAKLVFSTITATNRPADMYDWRTLWPGDTYVDVLGTDYYGDSYKNTVTAGASGFDSSGGPRNLPEYLAFAAGHGKPLAISEWGVDPVFGTGDDPAFIQYVYDFVSVNAGATAGKVTYECYFNESKSSTDRRQLYYAPSEADANGRTTTEFPLAAARYQSLF